MECTIAAINWFQSNGIHLNLVSKFVKFEESCKCQGVDTWVNNMILLIYICNNYEFITEIT